MKAFLCLAFVAFVALASATTSSKGATSLNTNTQTKLEVETEKQLKGDRFRKSAYGGGSAGGSYGGGAASIPAPPCPKNYLFSCQPNLAPAPCAAPAPSYGSAGAYTAHVPVYIAPVGPNYGVPQAWSGLTPEAINHLYQY